MCAWETYSASVKICYLRMRSSKKAKTGPAGPLAVAMHMLGPMLLSKLILKEIQEMDKDRHLDSTTQLVSLHDVGQNASLCVFM